MENKERPLVVPALCPAKVGTVCRCGQCVHRVRRAATAAGMSVESVFARLAAERSVSAPSVATTPRALMRRGDRVAVSVRVVCPDGTRLDGPIAAAAVLAAVQRQERK